MALNQNAPPKMSDLSGQTDRYTDWLGNFNTVLGSLTTGVASSANPGSAVLLTLGSAGLAYVDSMDTAWNTAKDLMKGGLTRIPGNIKNARVLRFGTRGVTDAPDMVPGYTAPPSGFKGSVAIGQIGALRAIIKKIQAVAQTTSTIDAGTLENLGLTPNENPRSTPKIPDAGPELYQEPADPGHIKIMFHQIGMRNTSKAKPAGCKGCLIKWASSNGGSGSQLFTKNPCDLALGNAYRGTTIRVVGAWAMGNNKYSPDSGNVLVVGVP